MKTLFFFSLLISFVLTVYLLKKKGNFFKKGISVYLSLFLSLSFLSFVVIFPLTSLSISLFGHSYFVGEETVELVAFGDKFSNETKGSFLLGTGDINSTDVSYYVYYYRDKLGGIKQGKVKAEKAVIYKISETSQPNLTIIKTRKKLDEDTNPTAHWFFGDISVLQTKLYEFHVPPGTISRNFKTNFD